jgi:hypothetical protein
MASVADCELLVRQGDRLFSDRLPLLSLWQKIAENFYVERADFTMTRNIGENFASHLTTSQPLRAHRELSNIISTIFRPQDKDWFYATVPFYEKRSEDAKRWLQKSGHILRRAMYDNDSNFSRATKESDDDLAAFGNTVISCEMNWRSNALLFRNWHLRDVVWCENQYGKISRVDRRWKPTAEDLIKIFPSSVHQKVRKAAEKNPYQQFEVRHTFMDAEDYATGKSNKRFKYVSIFYDVENRAILEEKYTNVPFYCIPRWKTISGSQYAYSPPTTSSLPDAFLIQDMMLVLLEAGQKAVDPPMISVGDALRSDINAYAGGITNVDADYDERLGEVLRPITRQNGAIPLGLDMLERTALAIEDAHFMTKIGLPPLGGGMSPYEVSQRINDYIRGALPLLDPLEAEYNGGICSLAFEVGFANGLFGPTREIPEDLLGENIEFKFVNPLRETMDRAKGNMLSEATGIIAQMASFDPAVQFILDGKTATRDTLDGIGAPREWFRTVEQAAELEAQQQQAAEMQQLMAMAQQGGDAAQSIGAAAQSLEQIRQ